MKMPAEQFDSLKADCATICGALGVTLEAVKTGADAWAVLHRVSRDRSYNDAHPGFADGHWTRHLPCICGPAENYLDRFYRHGLHDAHIKTALAAIFPNAVFSDKYRH